MMMSAEGQNQVHLEGDLPELLGAISWLNSKPLTKEELLGKVVLVDFWTYSCINCIRTLPYVTKWYDQSSNANHAINTSNNATQPNMTIQNGKWVLQFQNGNGTYFNITTPIQPNTIVCHYWNNNNSAWSSIITTAYDYEMRFYTGIIPTSPATYGSAGDWYYNGVANGGTCLVYNNGVAATSVLQSNWNYFCASVQTPQWVTGTTGGNISSFNRIGYDGTGASRAINGYMAEMICHNTTINATDIANLYNGRLF
jgi:thiol-disulfide isomerase/thioredoxin